MIPHCPDMIVPCLIDDLAHRLLRTNVRVQRYAGNLCRWHDDTSTRQYILDLHAKQHSIDQAVDDFRETRQHRARIIARARQIRKARR